MTKVKTIYGWKEGNHYRVAMVVTGKKTEIKCIKKLDINWKLKGFKKNGWTIMIGRPGEGKHV